MSCDGQKFPDEIGQLFAGRLSDRRRKRLRAHLAECDTCRTYYGRVSDLQARLTPNEPLGADLLRSDGLIARFAASPSLLRRGSRWVLGVGAAAAIGLAAFALAGRVSPRSGGEFQERGGVIPSRAESVRAYCITRGAGGATKVVDAAPLVRSPARSSLRCPLDGAIQFAYSDDAHARFLFLLGIDGSGNPLFYYPRSDERESVSLPADARDALLPDSIRLTPHHHPGPVRVIALFSSHPLEIAEVKRVVASGGVDGAAALGDDVEHLDLEIAPPEAAPLSPSANSPHP